MTNIPAFCPTCHSVFPSGFVLGEGVTANLEGNMSGCPKGHMGLVLDGTISAINGVAHIVRAGKVSAQVIEQIKFLAKEAEAGKLDAQEALDETISLLPSEFSSAIKNIGSQNHLATLLIILFIFYQISAITNNFTSSLKNVGEKDSPSIVFNDNHASIGSVTVIENKDNLSRQQRRQMERLRLKKEKRNNRQGKK